MALNLTKLNEHQREAVLHGLGPLLILAGAGSGKTSTMAHRIAHLIAERHVPGSAILGLSFTNKAAGELKQRVYRLVQESLGRRAARGLTVTTFHSLCARLLRVHAEELGFQTNFTILDQNDQIDILRQVLKNIRIDERRFDPEVILFELSQAKSRFLSIKEAESYFLESRNLSEDYALATASSFSKYQEQLRVLNAMDFDDLIYYGVRLLEEHAEVRGHYNDRFRHILVDEYQDTNGAQFRLLKLLTEHQQNLCVVGDDDQSIYAWRGADPSHILQFSQIYSEARTVALEQNYRSTSRILEAANHVIEKNRGRYPKKLWSERGVGEPITLAIVEDDRAEAEFVTEEIRKRTAENQKSWRDFAVLYRSNTQSRVFEEAFRRQGIPYKIVGGISFLARKEVKDVLSYWRLITNLKDDASLRRILNRPARGIGKSSIEVMSHFAFEQKISFFESFEESSRLAPKTAPALLGFRDLILKLQQSLHLTPFEPQAMSAWARGSLERIQMKRGIEEESDDPVQAARKWENVEELVHSLGQFQFSSSFERGSGEILEPGFESSSQMSAEEMLREFLMRMTLDAQESEKNETQKEDKNQVTLLTLHGAKGLEYPFVFMVGMEEGFLPHRRTIEEAVDFGEERRLCYVGITRAKDHLILTRAKNRIRYGKAVPRIPSRFLEEIPQDLLLFMNESGILAQSEEEVQKQHEIQVKNYLAEIRANLMKN